MRTLLRCGVLGAALLGVGAVTAAAQDNAMRSRAAPIVMTGEWEHHASATLHTGKWEILISDEKPEGALTGSLTYWGFRCNARGAPMSGTRAQKRLSLEARIGVCGKGTFELEETAPGLYAGTFAIEDAGAGEKKATLELRQK